MVVGSIRLCFTLYTINAKVRFYFEITKLSLMIQKKSRGKIFFGAERSLLFRYETTPLHKEILKDIIVKKDK